MSRRRIAVIGAGPGGMVAAPAAIRCSFELTIFERASGIRDAARYVPPHVIEKASAA